jgi:hypothetical protein
MTPATFITNNGDCSEGTTFSWGRNRPSVVAGAKSQMKILLVPPAAGNRSGEQRSRRACGRRPLTGGQSVVPI